jgi:2-keto-4-pentenoate hydratase/2-oxohepta-3-ene-1,7-dioic acid hydratase in catechol pathway
LVTFRGSSGEDRAGALVCGGSAVLDLQAAHVEAYGRPSPQLASVQAMIEAADASLDVAYGLVGGNKGKPREGGVDLAEVKLLAPVPHPVQMRDFVCFERHVIVNQARDQLSKPSGIPEHELDNFEASMARTLRERPVFYKPNRFNVIGPDQDVQWPAYSTVMDYELEFGCFLKGKFKDARREDASRYIFGYTAFNDLSARDEQIRDMMAKIGPAKGKDFDGSKVMGPCLVTADEMGDPYSLEMIVRVNGEERGRGNSRDMRFKFEDLIVNVSRSETLHPGEFFGSGTIPGGSGVNIGRTMNPGDVVELEVERIGILRTRILR